MAKIKTGDLVAIRGEHHARYSRNVKRTMRRVAGDYTENKDINVSSPVVVIGAAVIILGLVILSAIIFILVTKSY
jgi:hypothetical protein